MLEDIEWNIHWIFFYYMLLISLFIIEVVNKQILKQIQKVPSSLTVSPHHQDMFSTRVLQSYLDFTLNTFWNDYFCSLNLDISCIDSVKICLPLI